MVVFAALEFTYKIRSRACIGNNGITKFSDTSFESISAIEKGNVTAVLLNLCVNLMRFQMNASTDNS